MKKFSIKIIFISCFMALFTGANASVVTVNKPTTTVTTTVKPVVVSATSSSSSSSATSSKSPVVVMSTASSTSQSSAISKPIAVSISVEQPLRVTSVPDFINAQKNIFMAQQVMDQLLTKYNDFKLKIAKNPSISRVVISTTTGETSQISSQTVKKESFDYQQAYISFVNVISGANNSTASYIGACKGVLSAYQALYDTYKSTNDASGAKTSSASQVVFAKAKFQSNSPLLAMFATLKNAVVAFLTARFSVVNADYYAENQGAFDIFGDEKSPGLIDYSDAAITSVTSLLDDEFKAITADKNTPTSEAQALQNNYQTVVLDYIRKKNLLIAQTVMRLLDSLVAKNSVATLRFSTNQKPINDIVLEKYFSALQNACVLLAQNEKPENVNMYGPMITSSCNSLDQVLALASKSMSSLFYFNAMLLSKTIEDSFGSQSVDQEAILQAVQLMKACMSSAASYSVAAQDTATAQGCYMQITLLGTLFTKWVTAKKAYASLSYGTALASLNAAYTCATKLGLFHTAAFLLTQLQTINLEYEQSLFQLYVTNDSYKNVLSDYLKNAYLPTTTAYEKEQAGWCFVWSPEAFTDPNAIKKVATSDFYKGFYLLSNSALQTLQSVITTIGKNEFAVSQTVAGDLNIAKRALDNLVNALQEMLVQGTLFPDKQPADTNLYVNYYTPTAYREAFVQYQRIIQKIDAIDQLFDGITRKNTYFPLKDLIAGFKDIKNLGTLFRLHYARWAYCMGSYAYTYASSSSCLNDKVCVVYRNACFQFALCALRDSQRVYSILGSTQMVSTIQSKIQLIKDQAAGLVTFAQTLQAAWEKKTDRSVSELYDILFYYQLAALVDPTQYGALYSAALDALEQQEANKTLVHEFSEIYAAYLAYRAYLWATYIKNGSARAACKARLVQRCSTVVQIITALQQAKKAATDSAKSIEYGQQLQRLEDILATLSSGQDFDRTALQLDEVPFVVVQEIAEKNSLVTTKKATFVDGSSLVLSNVAYDLAQLRVKQADQDMARVKSLVEKRQFDAFKDDSFTSISANYLAACQTYSDLGVVTDFAETTVKLSALAALSYYSLVMPSDQPSGTANKNGGTVVVASKTSSKDGAPQQSTVSSKPLYLLRTWRHNLTDMVAIMSDTLQAAQDQNDTKALQNLRPSMDAYAGLLTAAKSLVGSTNMQEIITKVVVPLYQVRALQGGYQEVVDTLDERIMAYKNQLLELTKTGITLGGKTYVTKFTLATEKQLDGTDAIILNSYYVPLSPLPEFEGDMSVLTLYSRYQQFFAQTQDLVQTDIGSFVAIPDVNIYRQAQLLINQAYYDAVGMYESAIERIKSNLKNDKNFAVGAFASYKAQYARLQEIYLQIFSLYDALDQGQKDAGVITFDIQGLYCKKFQDYADTTAIFMMGNPLASEYITVVNAAAMNALIAINYTADVTQQAMLFTKAGSFYKKAGDLCAAATTVPRSINGYPKAGATGYLTTRINLQLPSTLRCAAQPKYAIGLGAPIVFNGFAQAYGYYQQAVKQYRAAYAILNKNSSAGEFNDPNVRTAWTLQAYAALSHAMQHLALFGRNAFEEIKTTAGSKVPSADCKISSSFQTMLQNAVSSSGTVVNSVSSLTGMGNSSPDDTVYAQDRFAIMKKLILEGLIYLSASTAVMSDIVKSIGSTASASSDTTKTAYGTALVCGTNTLFPGLGATFQDQPTLFGFLFGGSPKAADITLYLTLSQQYALLHADGFAQLSDYMFASLAGSAADGYAQFKDPVNIGALTNFISQMYNMTRTVYAQIFLSDIAGASDKDSIASLQMSINAAISNAQQEMLIDAAGYVG